MIALAPFARREMDRRAARGDREGAARWHFIERWCEQHDAGRWRGGANNWEIYVRSATATARAAMIHLQSRPHDAVHAAETAGLVLIARRLSIAAETFTGDRSLGDIYLDGMMTLAVPPRKEPAETAKDERVAA